MTSTAVILPRDFDRKTTSPGFTRWEVGPMRHVIAALDGAPVAITTDRLSGSTLIGVTLDSVVGTRGGTGYSVVVKGRYEGDPGCAYPLYSLGEAIVPLTRSEGQAEAKWRAIDSHREETSAAIRRAQAEHGEREGRVNGSWEARAGYSDVSVSYHPYRAPSSMAAEPRTVGGSFAHWTYRTRDLVPEAVA
jgi:hypothetical protein